MSHYRTSFNIKKCKGSCYDIFLHRHFLKIFLKTSKELSINCELSEITETKKIYGVDSFMIQTIIFQPNFPLLLSIYIVMSGSKCFNVVFVSVSNPLIFSQQKDFLWYHIITTQNQASFVLHPRRIFLENLNSSFDNVRTRSLFSIRSFYFNL